MIVTLTVPPPALPWTSSSLSFSWAAIMSACIFWTCLSIWFMLGGWGIVLPLRLEDLFRVELVLEALDELLLGAHRPRPRATHVVAQLEASRVMRWPVTARTASRLARARSPFVAILGLALVNAAEAGKRAPGRRPRAPRVGRPRRAARPAARRSLAHGSSTAATARRPAELAAGLLGHRPRAWARRGRRAATASAAFGHPAARPGPGAGSEPRPRRRAPPASCALEPLDPRAAAPRVDASASGARPSPARARAGCGRRRPPSPPSSAVGEQVERRATASRSRRWAWARAGARRGRA